MLNLYQINELSVTLDSQCIDVAAINESWLHNGTCLTLILSTLRVSIFFGRIDWWAVDAVSVHTCMSLTNYPERDGLT